MVDGPYTALARRGDACAMAGHYWYREHAVLGAFEKLPLGVEMCGWCRAYRFAWYADPSWLYCARLTIIRLSK